ncbi:pectinesterase family protein [Paenibacillus hunanensis]|uniref:Pectinesterase n=1 Tax=Paenibacillus hunanensis TaxID=539262 RepID=A0ABU1J5X9_9BACL|nr:pectinesterase family protein [Paenibacillus hunanensis]MDR6246635.1 pectinesterase [Paenibacillus hunanensis]GGJ00565.1 pectinesterase [Paenibacillus hunanensis]
MELIVGKASFCDYHSIQEAVDVLDQREASSEARDTIFILEGVYDECVIIHNSKLRLCGVGKVEITRSRHARQHNEQGEEIGTFGTPTVFLGGSDLLIENLTISNTAGQGEEIGQAVALTAYCDRTVIQNCTLRAYQDTLFTGPLPPKPKERAKFGGAEIRHKHEQYRQLYVNCYIEGTVDFIFGGATAYFEHCHIHSLRHYDNQPTYVTAASTPQGQKHGYVFHSCWLTGDEGITPVFLGRPWREYAQTVWVKCRLGEHIDPAGWDNWDNTDNERTVVYQEYDPEHADELRNTRVGWADCLADGVEKWDRQTVFGGEVFWEEPDYVYK